MVQLLPEQAQPAPAEASEVAQGSEAGAIGLSRGKASPVLPMVRAASGVAGIKDIEISNRDDVQVLLEKACQYMERTEPSHPAPMLIRRAQRLLDLNFFQIIEELVPEGLQKIESLAGRSLSTGTE